MSRAEKYNFVIFPIYRYATIYCDQSYFNDNFEEILKILGKHYFNEPSLGTDGICSRIKDKINREWHLNGLKKSTHQKRVSTNQIKTIRRTFQKLRDKEQNYIRLPFSVVPILFFILNLLNSIPVAELDNSEKKFINTFANSGKTIKEMLYDFHANIFTKEYNIFYSNLSDEKLKNKFQKLYANLTNRLSIMNCTYRNVNWNDLSQYII